MSLISDVSPISDVSLIGNGKLACLYFEWTIERSAAISIHEFREEELHPLEVPAGLVHEPLPETAVKPFDAVDVHLNFFAIYCHSS